LGITTLKGKVRKTLFNISKENQNSKTGCQWRSRDAEAKQYYRLYPSLSYLADLCGVLESLLQTKGDIEGRLPQQLKEIDLVDRKLVYEPLKKSDAHLERAAQLIL